MMNRATTTSTTYVERTKARHVTVKPGCQVHFQHAFRDPEFFYLVSGLISIGTIGA